MATVEEKKVGFPDGMDSASEIKGSDYFMLADGDTKETKTSTWDKAKDYLTITGQSLDPIASGALPTPVAGQVRTMEVVGPDANPDGSPATAIWTHPTLPGGQASLVTGQAGVFYFSNDAYALRNVRNVQGPAGRDGDAPESLEEYTEGVFPTDTIPESSIIRGKALRNNNTIEDNKNPSGQPYTSVVHNYPVSGYNMLHLQSYDATLNGSQYACVLVVSPTGVVTVLQPASGSAWPFTEEFDVTGMDFVSICFNDANGGTAKITGVLTSNSKMTVRQDVLRVDEKSTASNQALDYFVKQKYDPTKEIQGATTDYGNTPILGVNPFPNELLRGDNTMVALTDADSWVWRNVPTSLGSSVITRITGKLIRPGGASADQNAAVVGVKEGGISTALMGNLPQPSTGQLEEFDFDITEYDYFSIMALGGSVLPAGNDSEVTFYYANGKKSIINIVKEYVDEKTGSSETGNVVSVRNFGAEGDGATNDTQAFINALNHVKNQGGGKIIVPKGVYLANIELPDTVGQWMPIEIEGDSLPTQMFGTIGNFPINNRGSIIKPFDINKPIISQPPVTSGYQSFNLINAIIKNLTLRSNLATSSNALDLYRASQMIAENIQIDNGVYSVQAPLPMNQTYGIRTPAVENAALTILKNIAISGFYYGLEVNEHTYADYLNLTCNKNAIHVRDGNHASHIVRACIQRNQVGILAGGAHRLTIDQLNLEHAAVNQTDPNNEWQLTQWDVLDVNNNLRGTAKYSVVLGNFGWNNADFKKSGGTNFTTWPQTW